MENRIRLTRLSVAIVLILALVMGLAASPSFAAAPEKEKVKYLGKGKVEVEFDDDVDYKRTKVTVRDTSGKKYKASIYKKDDDELRFRIKKYKTGKTYKFTIRGVRDEDTRSYGKVRGKVKIKKATAKSKYISRSKAKSIAYNDAKKRTGVKSFYDLEIEKDRDDGVRVWDVQFKGKTSTYEYEYDYEIREKGGKIVKRDIDRDRIERDDDDDDDDRDDWDD